MNIELGKISRAEFGLGGYQDAQVGLWLTFEGKGWGVCSGYTGGWSFPPDDRAKWTLESQSNDYAKCVRDITQFLKDAKVDCVSRLVGVPVEVSFEQNTIKSFRILSEVL